MSYGNLMRREGDSNPRNALGVYTLSRRASSTTRAPLRLKRVFSNESRSANAIFSFASAKIVHFIEMKKYEPRKMSEMRVFAQSCRRNWR